MPRIHFTTVLKALVLIDTETNSHCSMKMVFCEATTARVLEKGQPGHMGKGGVGGNGAITDGTRTDPGADGVFTSGSRMGCPAVDDSGADGVVTTASR